MNSILDSVFAVFTAIAEWFGEIIPTISAFFYVAETGLTFMGTLTIIGLGISLIFLLIGLISNFLQFRG